jgi:RPA family protein
MFVHNPNAFPKHHKPKNVKLTGKAYSNPRGNVAQTFKGEHVNKIDGAWVLAKPHHETAEQAASRALARMLAQPLKLAA